MASTTRLNEVKVHASVLLGAAVATGVPNIGFTYGYAGSWCWIDPDKRFGRTFQFGAFFIPLWVIIACVCVMYFRYVADPARRAYSHCWWAAALRPSCRARHLPCISSATRC